MWAIRVLSGPQTGQIIPLKAGTNSLGRAPNCEVRINSNGVSKVHASILVTEDKVIVTDSDSRNGTFVNGVRIQNQRINTGDKLGLHEVLIDIIKLPDGAALPGSAPAWAGNAALRLKQQQQQQYNQQAQYQAASHLHLASNPHGAPHAMSMDNLNPHGMHDEMHSHNQGHEHQNHSTAPEMRAGSLADLFHNLKVYVENVAMPGVYMLAQALPYRLALAAMVGLFVVSVTLLSTIPMVNVTKAGIRQESVRRAKTIARNMAANNRQAVIDKNELAITVKSAELEEGVTDAFIISAKDGIILAPANKRGEFANKPFVAQVRREEHETEGFISDSQLGVGVPITYFNPEKGDQSVIAFAIVLYDMEALAMNASQTLSLLIQNLLIALIAGGILYFFLYKIVEHPIIAMNTMLDDALREGRDDISTQYRYPILEALSSNINSALSRIHRGQPGESPLNLAVSRDIEASNIVRMMTVAAISINAIDDRIIATNEHFNRLIGGSMDFQGRPISDIPDQALQKKLREEMIPKMRESMAELALGDIPFPNGRYEISGQTIMGGNEPSYFLVILVEPSGE
jgi:hypothetical protein